MKKYLIGVAVLLLVGGTLWLAAKTQAQAPALDTGHGRLWYYTVDVCSGSYSADAGHRMEWSSDGGSSWHDGVNTDGNGYFTQTLHIQYSGPVYIRGKATCNDQDHPHTPCTRGGWSYADNPGTSEVGEIFNKYCTTPEK